MKKFFRFMKRFHKAKKPQQRPEPVEREYLVVYEETVGGAVPIWSIRTTSVELAKKAFLDAGLVWHRIVGVAPAC